MSVINTNITSMIGQQNLQKSQNALQTSMERLSSGLRINSAKDDAAGQAIANRMTAQITGLAQAQRNANDGISVAQTAEGALNQVNDNLQRIRELTVQAQNGTNSENDLASIQEEIDQRLAEIDRISEQTDFNGVKVLNTDEPLRVQVGANDGETISIGLDVINRNTLKMDGFDPSKAAGPELGKMLAVSEDFGAVYEVKDANGNVVEDMYAAIDDRGNIIALTTESEDLDDGSSYEAVTYTDENGNEANATYVFSGDDREVVVAAKASDGNFYTVENEDDWSEHEDIAALQGAETKVEVSPGALKQIDDALKQVDNLRSELGAVQNRFEDAITNLQTNETNLAAARSRIEDADYAVEVANMTRAQILQQAGTSVLAQANQIPQNVLSLLG